MNNTSKGLDNFLTYLREIEQLCRISEANEQEANDKTRDILHSLELENHDYHEYARLAKELKETRQQRRAAKDLLSATTPVIGWLESNRPVVKSLERLLGEVRKAEKNTENRIYTPRTK